MEQNPFFPSNRYIDYLRRALRTSSSKQHTAANKRCRQTGNRACSFACPHCYDAHKPNLARMFPHHSPYVPRGEGAGHWAAERASEGAAQGAQGRAGRPEGGSSSSSSTRCRAAGLLSQPVFPGFEGRASRSQRLPH